RTLRVPGGGRVRRLRGAVGSVCAVRVARGRGVVHVSDGPRRVEDRARAGRQVGPRRQSEGLPRPAGRGPGRGVPGHVAGGARGRNTLWPLKSSNKTSPWKK